MHRKKKIACVIPVRLTSTRFPRKALAEIEGKPLVWWVWQAALKCPHFDERLFAVDSEELADVVCGFGAPAILTDPACVSGTDRLVEVRGQVSADVWVNWQGDEPLITPQMIEDLLQSCDEASQDVWTLMHTSNELNPAAVKVVCDLQGKALYFSRSPIPFGSKKFNRHVGLYAYSDEALKQIGHMEPTPLELSEKLEQLRFLEHGLHVQVHSTAHPSQGVDLPEHLALVEKLLTSATIA